MSRSENQPHTSPTEAAQFMCAYAECLRLSSIRILLASIQFVIGQVAWRRWGNFTAGLG